MVVAGPNELCDHLRGRKSIHRFSTTSSHDNKDTQNHPMGCYSYLYRYRAGVLVHSHAAVQPGGPFLAPAHSLGHLYKYRLHSRHCLSVQCDSDNLRFHPRSSSYCACLEVEHELQN